jgi:cytochrome c oxidase subunit 2
VNRIGALPGPRKALRLLSRAIALAVVGAAAAAPLAHGQALTPPTPESPNASDIESSYLIALVVFIAIVVVVNLALILPVLRSRARRSSAVEPPRRRRRGQRRAGAALTVLAAALFTVGVVFTERASQVDPSGPDGLQAAAARSAQVGIEPPVGDAEPLTIEVAGQQWIWRYAYPDGTFSFYELVVPVDTTVVLELSSTDVLHSWWVPALGGKFEVSPGQTNRTWFKADREGTFDGQSAAFSGPGYASMRSRVRVVSTTEYNAWLSRQADDITTAQEAVQLQVETGSVPGLSAIEAPE